MVHLSTLFLGLGSAEWNLGQYYQIAWTELREKMRPGQLNIGYAWMESKRNIMKTSLHVARRMLRDRVVPAVWTNHGLVSLDNHHHLVALEESNKGFWPDVHLNFTVLCDLRDLSDAETLEHLLDNQMIHPFRRNPDDHKPLPNEDRKFRISELPKTWTEKSFINDDWRSLVGFLSHLTNENCPKDNRSCYRCFERMCNSDPSGYHLFQEHQWSYYLNDLAHRRFYYDPKRARRTPRSLENDPSYTADMEALDTFFWDGPPPPKDLTSWTIIASQILPVCHKKEAKKYNGLPLHLSWTGLLSGWVPAGSFAQKHNGECRMHQCSSTILA